MSSAICFNLDQCKILLSGNELSLSQMTNFRCFQAEKFADNNFEFDENDEVLHNPVGKG